MKEVVSTLCGVLGLAVACGGGGSDTTVAGACDDACAHLLELCADEWPDFTEGECLSECATDVGGYSSDGLDTVVACLDGLAACSEGGIEECIARGEDVSPGATKAGDLCQSDADCSGDARCINSLVNGAQKYCALPCSSADSCPFYEDADTWYAIGLPDNLKNANRWNYEVLWRGQGCADAAEYPSLGVASGSYCVFVCPINSAAVYCDDGSGAICACACLPNYSDVDASDEVQDCQWDEATECSLFTSCTVENTDVSECSQGDFTCFVNEGLEGLCVDLVSGDDIEQCVFDRCGSADCDTSCLSSCGGTPLCVDACCNC